MRYDARADKEFRKRYHLKGNQVKLMRETFAYQWFMLRLYTGDIFRIIKSLFTGGKI